MCEPSLEIITADYQQRFELEGDSNRPNCLFDKFGNRFRLIRSSADTRAYNFVFLPGGPGACSDYFLPLIERLALPGHYWTLDLFGSGTLPPKVDFSAFDYRQWFDWLPKLANTLPNTVLVAHSFAGILALSEPELETSLSGLILLNTAPRLWHEAAEQKLQQLDLTLDDAQITPYIDRPTQQSYEQAQQACAPLYFTEAYLPQGKAMLTALNLPYQTATFFLNWALHNVYTFSWLPKKLPTFILGGAQDAIMPFHLFTRDQRFFRNNISLYEIENAGHICWLEQPQEVADILNEFPLASLP